MKNLRKTLPIILNQRAYASQATEVAVVKLPSYVQKHIEKVKIRDATRKFDVMRKVHRRGDTSVPVISCNKKEYNFYLGQIYNHNFPVPIMSRYWMKMKSAGQKFTINSWAPNPSLPVKFEVPKGITEIDNDLQSMAYYITEFSQLNISDPILRGLSNMGFEYPTPIQTLVIPRIMEKKNVLCVAETGCGKTMSYLIPVFQSLLMERNRLKRYPDTPLALVIVPGRELAEQIGKVAYTLGESCGIKVKVLVPDGTEFEPLVPKSNEEVDLLVATFGMIYKLSYRGIFKISHLQHLVLDEADTLLDDSFKEEMKNFFRRTNLLGTGVSYHGEDVGTQLTFVSSTMPTDFSSVDNIDSLQLERVVSPHMHRVLPHISQKFIRVNNENRSGIALELIKTDFNKKIPVMVFCNKSPTCYWISHFLSSNDIPNATFHAGMSYYDRSESYRNFQSGDVDVFCCTDLASRGLDTQWVKHIINFDFPNSMSDYILRVGRIGRVGTNHGHVTNLVVSASGVYVVQDIEMAVRQSTKLENVDANITKKIQKLYHSY